MVPMSLGNQTKAQRQHGATVGGIQQELTLKDFVSGHSPSCHHYDLSKGTGL